MKEHLVKVPYGDFVDGIQAMSDLDSIRALIDGGEYASSAILSVLGIPKKENINAGTDRE